MQLARIDEQPLAIDRLESEIVDYSRGEEVVFPDLNSLRMAMFSQQKEGKAPMSELLEQEGLPYSFKGKNLILHPKVGGQVNDELLKRAREIAEVCAK